MNYNKSIFPRERTPGRILKKKRCLHKFAVFTYFLSFSSFPLERCLHSFPGPRASAKHKKSLKKNSGGSKKQAIHLLLWGMRTVMKKRKRNANSQRGKYMLWIFAIYSQSCMGEVKVEKENATKLWKAQRYSMLNLCKQKIW